MMQTVLDPHYSSKEGLGEICASLATQEQDRIPLGNKYSYSCNLDSYGSKVDEDRLTTTNVSPKVDNEFSLNTQSILRYIGNQEIASFLLSVDSFQELFRCQVQAKRSFLKANRYSNKYHCQDKDAKLISPKVNNTKFIALRRLNSLLLKIFLKQQFEIEDLNLQIVELHILAEILIRKNRNTSVDM